MRFNFDVLESQRIMKVIPFFISFILIKMISVQGTETLCHIISAGKVLRPGQIYGIGVHICSKENVDLSCTIHGNDEPVVGVNMKLNEDETEGLHLLPLKIPQSITNGIYKLIVQGRALNSNKAFYNVTALEFSPKFLSIVVQTSRPIYTNSQTVRFRVLALQTNLVAYDDALEIKILDPDGFVMKRWLSIYTNNGVASLHFDLPSLVKEGFWKIQVKTQHQIEEQIMKVINHFPPYFEVFVEMPPYISRLNELSAEIYGMFPTQEYIKGNASLRLFFKQNNSYEQIWATEAFIKHKTLKIDFSEKILTEREAGELKLEVKMTDFMYGSTSKGYAISKISPLEKRIRFLSKGVLLFQAPFPFNLYLSVDHSDGSAIEPEKLEKYEIKIFIKFMADDILLHGEDITIYPFDIENAISEYVIPDSITLEDFTQKGLLGIKISPMSGVKMIKIKATLWDGVMEAETELVCRNKFDGKGIIQVTSSTSDPIVGEYAIFHVSSDVEMRSFQYLIVSKNNIVNSGEKIVNEIVPTITTFSVALGPDMAPGFRIIVYTQWKNGLISDSLYVPINGFNRYQMEFTLNEGKDHKGDNVEIIVGGDEGAYISVNSMRSMVYKLQAGNDLSLSRVLKSFMAFEKYEKHLNKIERRSRTGEIPEMISYHQTLDNGKDSAQSFMQSGLILFTNLESENLEECTNSSFWCYDGGCFNESQSCDGKSDCNDGSDELNCEPKLSGDYQFLISRLNPTQFLFDVEYGDWGWREIKKNDHIGIEFDKVDAPVVADDWYFNAFSVSSRYGFSIIENPFIYSTKRMFSAHLSGPKECRRGEQVGLRLLLQNHQTFHSMVFVRLIHSSDYKFVKVPENGIVTSYNAKLVSGDQNILVYVPASDQARINIPIAPTIEHGEIEVVVSASADATLSIASHVMRVLPEGASMKRHTSNILDLKNRALVKTYFDIPIEETPIVPYSEWRRYIYGSPRGHVSVTGDLIGPTHNIGKLNINSLLGREEKGTDVLAFEFAVNILTVHYFRVTNFELESNDFKERLAHASVLYSGIMKRFDPKGFFRNWDHGQPSVWLTAWVVRILQIAVYADWENIIYIDRQVFTLALHWLSTKQTKFGSFDEDKFYKFYNLNNTGDIILTSHVLISLCECSQYVDGVVKNEVLTSIRRASAYLGNAHLGNDPYSLIIACYALLLAESEERSKLCQTFLDKPHYDRDGNPYWARKHVKSNSIRMANQRPFVQPRTYTESDSIAVEMTSYALLILLSIEGVTPKVDKIVLWLSSMRMTDNGFISKTDSIIALQALTEYANRARLVDLTKVGVIVDSPVDSNFIHFIPIQNKSRIDDPLEMDKIWGHLNIMGQGAGLVLVQMDLSYGVDVESLIDKPETNSFELTINEYYSEFRNKSAIIIESCTKWIRDWPENSGYAVLEIDIPSGYQIVESDAEELALRSLHPTLKDARILPTKTIWFFESITKEKNCFNHTIRRWFPVGNMTLHRQALLYEANQRENFVQVLFNSSALYTLSICDVCGSYQCPYCPYYNSMTNIKPNFLTLIFVFILLMSHFSANFYNV